MKIIIKTAKFGMLLGVSFLFSNCVNCGSGYSKEIKERKVYGVIKSQYLDKENHNTPTFVLGEDNKILTLIGLRDLFLVSNVGDTILKDTGSLNYKLIKSDTILIFNVKCNGKPLK